MLIVDGGDENVRGLVATEQLRGELELVFVPRTSGREQELGQVPHEDLIANVLPVYGPSNIALQQTVGKCPNMNNVTDFVFFDPGVNILDDVRLILQITDKALQLGKVSAVVDSLEKGNTMVSDGIETNWGMLVDGL